jgi:helix-turn-helix protein
MTVEAPLLAPVAASRLLFLDELPPLPLCDPTEAARLLRVQRHTLACYRNLGCGPAYYKFGRWIRYAQDDLDAWARRDNAEPRPLAVAAGLPPDSILLVDTATAARFLTLSRFCLLNHRAEGSGPRVHRYGRRSYYSAQELCAWAMTRRIIPATRDQSTVIPLTGIVR